MNKATHTNTPWEVNTLAGANRTEVFSGNVLICDTLSGTVDRFKNVGTPEANAARIVLAVNSFDALVEALGEWLPLIESKHGWNIETNKSVERAKDAYSKARGEVA